MRVITMNVRTAAEHLGCSPAEVRALCAKGKLQHIKITPTITVITPQAINEWLNRKPEPSPAPRKPVPKYVIGDIVYFVEAPSARLIKIGTSGYFGGRLKGLLSQSAVRLQVLGCIEGNVNVERELHARFAQYRKHGEWFRATPALRQAIADILADRGVEYMELE